MKSFQNSNIRLVPENVNYNGRQAIIWTMWELDCEAWVHNGKFSTPRKVTRAAVLDKAIEMEKGAT